MNAIFTKGTTQVGRKRKEPSAAFVQAVQDALSAGGPTVTRINQTSNDANGDRRLSFNSRSQAYAQAWRFDTGANSLLPGGDFDSFANQFCAFFVVANLAALVVPRELFFINNVCTTTVSNQANAACEVEWWFVHPRSDTSPAALSVAGVPTASIFSQPYETIMASSLLAGNTVNLTGPTGGPDRLPLLTDLGVSPYDCRMFCEHYRLQRGGSAQLQAGKTFSFRHRIDWNRNISIPEFFDLVNDEYTVQDMAGLNYGILFRAQGIGGGDSGDTDVGTIAGQISWHTISHVRFRPVAVGGGVQNDFVSHDGVVQLPFTVASNFGAPGSNVIALEALT